jgi:hypothetical protein
MVYKEGLFPLQNIQFRRLRADLIRPEIRVAILVPQEEVQRAVQVIHLVHIATHLQVTDHLHLIAADPPVQNQGVLILPVPLLVLLLILHLVLHPDHHQVLQHAGDSLNDINSLHSINGVQGILLQ